MTLPTETAEHVELKAIRKAGNSETRSRRTRNAGFAGRATTPVGAARSACRGLPALPYLLVRDCSTRRAGKMDDFEAVEADFAAPFFEIGSRIIECVAEFDQHV